MTCTVKEDTLTDIVSCMSETTVLVHQMPFVCDRDRDGFSGVLEKVIGMGMCCEKKMVIW